MVVLGALVHLQVQLGLGLAGGGGFEAGFEHLVGHALAVPAQAAVGLDRQVDLLGLDLLGLAAGLGEVELHRVVDHRHGDDEDDQQNQHHVHQGRHVDLRHHLAVVVEAAVSEAHGASLRGAMGWTLAGALFFTRPPVTR